jgi:hypothetical protein
MEGGKMLPVTHIFSRKQAWPGQVPQRVDPQLIGPQKIDDFDKFNRLTQGTVSTAREVVSGLGLTIDKENEWTSFLQGQIVGQMNELEFRKSIVIKAMSDNLDPILKNIIGVRAIKYFRTVKKSICSFALVKAIPRGGSYYRRVPKKNGNGYNYYYNKEMYEQSKNAHLGGDDTTSGYLSNKVKNILGEGAQSPEVFKNLVKKHGLDKIVSVMEELSKKGDLKISKGKFYWSESEG